MNVAHENLPERESPRSAVERAARRVAPLWPLDRFVAVNPFMGVSEQSFSATAAEQWRISGARLFKKRSDYRAAIDEGRILPEDIDAALALESPDAPTDREALLQNLQQGPTQIPPTPPTIAHYAGLNSLRVESVSRWAAGYFDTGQARWPSPFQDLSAYRAWREEAMIDRSPELSGLKGFRRFVRELPEDPEQTVERAIARIGVDASSSEMHLAALAMSLSGWLGYARFLSWEAELRGFHHPAPFEIMAILLAWEWAILERVPNAVHWQNRLTAPNTASTFRVESIMQSALEISFQREVREWLAAASPSEGLQSRPAAQVVFCIDVRSELMRRALEGVQNEVQTIGFAGFFGLPIEATELGEASGTARCPALLAPSAAIVEAPGDAGEREILLDTRGRQNALKQAWKQFKLAAVSSFAFVESVGLLYIVKLVTDSLGLTRPVPADAVAPTPTSTLHVESRTVEGREVGFTEDALVDLAEGMLRGMGLLDHHARLVVFAGHGASVVNNPYASGLQCGACGGHSGSLNARVAAHVLNRKPVRRGLSERGIDIPEDTHFVAALHDTTTDALELLDPHLIPKSHQDDRAELERSFKLAGTRCREERAPRLGLAVDQHVDREIEQRSRDWSQVRAEWGLARCSAFIAAPRKRTRGVSLDGRSFLHDYEWQKDPEFKVLETIMTAPMVVASWIAWQYFASAADNRVYGSGNKTLHNVVAGIGVLEGNGGDLRTGLPLQSVHDGSQLFHEPMRLSVLIEAPVDAMNDVIGRHSSIRSLLDNGWLHLIALNEKGEPSDRYVGGQRWTSLLEETAN